MKHKTTIYLVLASFLTVAFLSVSPLLGAEAEVKTPETFTEWMDWLPQETQDQVMMVFRQSMNCLDKSQLNSTKTNEQFDIYLELQLVLNNEQYSVLMEIVNGKHNNPQLSMIASDCGHCLSAVRRLGMARLFLSLALRDYDRSYCDFGIGDIDKVYIYIGMAKNFAENARDTAQEAYDACDCDKALSAISLRNDAANALATAISNADTYCTDPPWKGWLNLAKNELDNAVSFLLQCKNQTCN